MSDQVSLPKLQRTKMRELYRSFLGDEQRSVAAYAQAERSGEVVRRRNAHGLSPEQYARALFADGVKKGWIIEN